MSATVTFWIRRSVASLKFNASPLSELILTKPTLSDILLTAGSENKAGRSPAKKNRPASTRNDPKAARSPKLPCWTARVKRMESTMPRKPKGPPPVAAEKPAYTIVKQTKSRWWEVRDPDDELVCLTVYRKGAREVVRRLAA